MVLKEVPHDEYTEYFEDSIRFLKESSNYSVNSKTGEHLTKVNLVLAIVTKPLDSEN